MLGKYEITLRPNIEVGYGEIFEITALSRGLAVAVAFGRRPELVGLGVDYIAEFVGWMKIPAPAC